MDLWAYQRGVFRNFSRPGKATDNAFDSKLRSEWLNAHWFLNLQEAREKLEDWRIHYNEERPHSAIGNIPPIILANSVGAIGLEKGGKLQTPVVRRWVAVHNAARLCSQLEESWVTSVRPQLPLLHRKRDEAINGPIRIWVAVFHFKEIAMRVPEIKNFHAYHNTQPPGPGNLYVIGEVKTENGARRPILRKTEPQGKNPAILLLTLTIEKTGDPGTKDIAFRDARYDHEGSYDGRYEAVEVLFEGSSIETLIPQIIS